MPDCSDVRPEKDFTNINHRGSQETEDRSQKRRLEVRMATRSYKELIVWRKAHSFVLNVYALSEGFPKSELYGLTSQFRRAAVSIAANIAEGYVKKTPADKLRFFNISQGSLEECSYYIVLAKDLKYITEAQSIALDNLLAETTKLLQSYVSRIQSSN